MTFTGFVVWQRRAGGWQMVVSCGSLAAAERTADMLRRSALDPADRDPRRWAVLPAGQKPDPADGAARIAQPLPAPTG